MSATDGCVCSLLFIGCTGMTGLVQLHGIDGTEQTRAPNSGQSRPAGFEKAMR
jgi:hypothetical protein